MQVRIYIYILLPSRLDEFKLDIIRPLWFNENIETK
jgi:hypothetical protein